jgi:hypothetical protein
MRGGRVHLHDKIRIGTSMKSRYLGEGTPELRARLARAAEQNADAVGRAARRWRGWREYCGPKA